MPRNWFGTLNDNLYKGVLRITLALHNPWAAYYFVKALILYFILKIVFTWKAVVMVLPYQDFVVPQSILGKLLLAPSLIAEDHIGLFYGLFLVLSIAILFTRPNYFCNALFFWMVISFYKVILPVSNGSDNVLLVLSILAVPLSFYPLSKVQGIRQAQTGIFNLFVWFIQLEICLIYFISGYDKLMSPVWRSGEAFALVAHLDTMFVSGVQDWFKNPVSNFLFAWATILFEVLFCIAVWFEHTRWMALISGLLFHFGIWFLLNLPDFMVMTIPYLLFIKNEEYNSVRARIKRTLPF